MDNNFSKILGIQLLKISDVHEGTGINKTTLTDFYYKRGASPNLSTLKKICDFLQISLSELIEYTPRKEG